MNRLFIILLFILFSANQSISQPWKTARFEAYGGVTGFQYFGDIGGTADNTNLFGLKDINLLKLRPGITGGLRYHIKKPWQIKATFVSGIITQSDENSRNENRNLSFTTFVNEISVVAEYYIIPESEENYYYSIMQIRGGLRHFKQPFSLYVFAGTGALIYNVRPNSVLQNHSNFNGDKHFTLALPAGIGLKFAVLPKISIGAELGGRFTLTDYLDGYSSDFSSFNDVYYSFAVVMNYKFKQTRGSNIGIKRRRFFF